MVNGTQTVSLGNGQPLFVRASSAAALSAESAAAAALNRAPASQVASATGQALRYNSFEFSYRQDFGKIVLLRQSPDTGEVVQQFPSEYYLRKYADSERVARSVGVAQGGDAEPAAARTETSGTVSDSDTGAAEIAPAIPSAPALPDATVAAEAAPASARVDITI